MTSQPRPRHLPDLNAPLFRVGYLTLCGQMVSRAGSVALRENEATCTKCVAESLTRVAEPVR